MSDGTVGTPPEPQIDWNAAVRRERRREAGTFALMLVALAAFLPLRFDPSSTSDRPFVVIVGLLVLAGSCGVAGWLWGGAGPRRTDRHRSLYALLEHVDPGVGLRGPTHLLARRQAPNRWLFWLPSAALMLQTVEGRWSEPAVALPSAAIFFACLAAVMWRMNRLGVAGRRWLDEPPVPISFEDV
ncbi:hypothetical protein [Blastococcus haudaquaticus]|uniref:Uncharacterized protein n=1 Tax=Blastococcus haudaquaticus TaxID=1938745 RepID=A0A286H6C9_9ACTN|nr:hypothetical protein [Blastococcus haudaquaticus]SOE03301.1 hypothetical protein SAMN06272739_4085 [Blastococcus haudaquaticus]